MAFEQLMAEAAKKQEKKKDKDTPADTKKENHHHSHNPFASAKPGEEMPEAEAKERAQMAGKDPTDRI